MDENKMACLRKKHIGEEQFREQLKQKLEKAPPESYLKKITCPIRQRFYKNLEQENKKRDITQPKNIPMQPFPYLKRHSNETKGRGEATNVQKLNSAKNSIFKGKPTPSLANFEDARGDQVDSTASVFHTPASKSLVANIPIPSRENESTCRFNRAESEPTVSVKSQGAQTGRALYRRIIPCYRFGMNRRPSRISMRSMNNMPRMHEQRKNKSKMSKSNLANKIKTKTSCTRNLPTLPRNRRRTQKSPVRNRTRFPMPPVHKSRNHCIRNTSNYLYNRRNFRSPNRQKNVTRKRSPVRLRGNAQMSRNKISMSFRTNTFTKNVRSSVTANQSADTNNPFIRKILTRNKNSLETSNSMLSSNTRSNVINKRNCRPVYSPYRVMMERPTANAMVGDHSVDAPKSRKNENINEAPIFVIKPLNSKSAKLLTKSGIFHIDVKPQYLQSLEFVTNGKTTMTTPADRLTLARNNNSKTMNTSTRPCLQRNFNRPQIPLKFNNAKSLHVHLNEQIINRISNSKIGIKTAVNQRSPTNMRKISPARPKQLRKRPLSPIQTKNPLCSLKMEVRSRLDDIIKNFLKKAAKTNDITKFLQNHEEDKLTDRNCKEFIKKTLSHNDRKNNRSFIVYKRGDREEMDQQTVRSTGGSSNHIKNCRHIPRIVEEISHSTHTTGNSTEPFFFYDNA